MNHNYTENQLLKIKDYIKTQGVTSESVLILIQIVMEINEELRSLDGYREE
jgi:hypothetical protein